MQNPHNSPNGHTIYKTTGYANLLIGTVEREGDIPADQVTISIFRSGNNPELFGKWGKSGRIVKTGTPGIYRVSGIASMPFRVVITGEPTGDECAACRALTD